MKIIYGVKDNEDTCSQFQLLALQRTKPVVGTEPVLLFKPVQVLTQDYLQN